MIVRYGTSDQLAQLGVRKEVEREGILRAIEIEDADLQPCGGTHVKSTGQIGTLLVRRCSKVRQDFRVEFACGQPGGAIGQFGVCFIAYFGRPDELRAGRIARGGG